MSDGFGVEPGSLPPVVTMFESRAGDLQAAAAVPVREAARLATAAGDAGLAGAAAVFGAGVGAAVDGLGQECRLLGRSLATAATAYREVDRSVPASGPRPRISE